MSHGTVRIELLITGKSESADESASHALSGCHYARLPEH